jgi:hypothetical protein
MCLNMHDSASTDGALKCAEMSNFQFKVDAHTLEVALSICHRLMLGKRHSLFATGALPDLSSKDPMNRCKPVCFQDKYARVTAACCLSLALKFCQVHPSPSKELSGWAMALVPEDKSRQAWVDFRVRSKPIYLFTKTFSAPKHTSFNCF